MVGVFCAYYHRCYLFHKLFVINGSKTKIYIYLLLISTEDYKNGHHIQFQNILLQQNK